MMLHRDSLNQMRPAERLPPRSSSTWNQSEYPFSLPQSGKTSMKLTIAKAKAKLDLY